MLTSMVDDLWRQINLPPEEKKRWRKALFLPFEVQIYIDNDVAFEKAEQWHMNHVPASEAVMRHKLGYGPDDMVDIQLLRLDWLTGKTTELQMGQFDLSTARIVWWEMHGLDPEKMVRWSPFFDNPGEAAPWIEKFDDDPQRAKEWSDLNKQGEGMSEGPHLHISPAKAICWDDYGFYPDCARPWLTIDEDMSPSDVWKWKRAGLSLEQVVEIKSAWSTLIKEIEPFKALVTACPNFPYDFGKVLNDGLLLIPTDPED